MAACCLVVIIDHPKESKDSGHFVDDAVCSTHIGILFLSHTLTLFIDAMNTLMHSYLSLLLFLFSLFLLTPQEAPILTNGNSNHPSAMLQTKIPKIILMAIKVIPIGVNHRAQKVSMSINERKFA